MTETPKTNTPAVSDRSRARAEWMGVLARAPESQLEAVWGDLSADHGEMTYSLLRGPEKGLVMVRGRASGDGQAFNLGEMTMTRCSVRLADGTVGHGYVAGRSVRHAELAAVFDGMMQIPSWAEYVTARLLAPVKASLAVARAQAAAKTAATKVEFFTMVREQGAPQE